MCSSASAARVGFSGSASCAKAGRSGRPKIGGMLQEGRALPRRSVARLSASCTMRARSAPRIGFCSSPKAPMRAAAMPCAEAA
ncbi:MAG: hypothetical protein B7Z53_00820 [Rhodospirillales bacterium 12-71-4]|nr:MAG: hypothetical protein B7Z53_00820 [Rhodospirillales bacterium 12-71-4]